MHAGSRSRTLISFPPLDPPPLPLASRSLPILQRGYESAERQEWKRLQTFQQRTLHCSMRAHSLACLGASSVLFDRLHPLTLALPVTSSEDAPTPSPTVVATGLDTPRLPSLPFELLEEIVAQIAPDDFDTLSSICLVSKSFNTSFTKLLYRRMLYLHFPRNGRFGVNPQVRNLKVKRTLISRPDLAAIPTCLFISVTDNKRLNTGEMDLVSDVFALATGLTSFRVSPFTTWDALLPILYVTQRNSVFLNRITLLDVFTHAHDPANDAPLWQLISRLPSLVHLSTYEIPPRLYTPLETFSCVLNLSRSTVNHLSSLSHLSLRRAYFAIAWGETCDWSKFTNLKEVRIRGFFKAERGEDMFDARKLHRGRDNQNRLWIFTTLVSNRKMGRSTFDPFIGRSPGGVGGKRNGNSLPHRVDSQRWDRVAEVARAHAVEGCAGCDDVAVGRKNSGNVGVGDGV